MCSAFTPDCGYDDSTNILMGELYCPRKKCLGKICLPKRLSNLLAEAIINFRNVSPEDLFLLKIKHFPFSCRLVKGLTLFKRVQNQFKMLLEMSIVLASIVPTERNANLLVVM